MPRSSDRRRLAVATAGLALAATVAAGCSSGGGTSPLLGGGSDTSSSASGGHQSVGGGRTPGAGTGTGVAPKGGTRTTTSADNPGGTASDAKFCSDYLHNGLTQLTRSLQSGPNGVGKVLQVWSGLADEAPAAVKGSVEDIVAALQKFQSDPGNIDTNSLQHAFAKLTTWATQHCVP